MESKLWNLYNFIKKRTLAHIKTTVEDVCNEFKDTYKLNAKESNFSNCPKLYEDIDTINSDDHIQKIIIKDNNDFRLATEQEAHEYEQKLLTRALKELKKYWAIKRKIDHNDKARIFTADGKYIDENSQARQFIESFIDSEFRKITYTDEELQTFSLKQLHSYLISIGGMGYNGWTTKDYIQEIRLQEQQNNKEGK